VLIIFSSSIIAPITALADTAIPTPDTTTLTEPSASLPDVVEEPATEVSTQLAEPEPQTTQLPDSPAISETSSASIDTSASQQTQSGDATISNSDDVGNSVTGSASGDAELLNQANNITSLGGSVALLDATPSTSQDYIVSPLHSNQSSALANLPQGDIVIQNDATIMNDVTVDSTTGSISAISNDTVGNLSTGDALSSVAILNLANNIVTTGDIFVGTITLDDSYQNDVILSEALLDRLINGSGKTTEVFNGNVSVESLQVITNDIYTAAQSGTVDATKNDTVGDIQTGSASTDIDIANTTGSYAIFGNALLVIVTTTGDWNGNMLHSPGSYIALITVDATGKPVLLLPESDVSTEVNTIVVSNKSTVTNTVSATATSGNVVAYKNDDIGTITTGDANVSVTIRNVLTNIVSISDWLGIVFINVFGDWNGNVIMQQSTVPSPVPQTSSTESGSPPPVSQYVMATKVPYYSSYITTGSPSPISESPQTIVAAATQLPLLIPSETISDSSALWLLIVTIIGGGLFAGQRVFTIKQASL
jgi:hypothetical protein